MSPRLDIIQSVASTQADHGGPSRSVPFLCEALAEQGSSVRLVTAVPRSRSPGEVILPQKSVTTCTVERAQGLLGTLQSPFSFYRTLQRTVDRRRPTLLHDHGVWLPSNAAAAFFAWRRGIPLVISTRGMLTSWALQHNRRKKQLAWTGYQKWVLRQARLFHVTSQEEVDALRELGLDQPAAIVPNGVPLPELSPEDPSPSDERRALFLSRIHPKKGLPMLIRAWAEVAPENWVLEMVGPSEEGHRDELERQVRRAGLGDAVRFSGPVSDDRKWEVYRSADLFVLPTHSENFGIVVAEALAAGVPAITTTGTPWNDLEAHDCGWWVEPAPESIADALAHATALDPEERTEMGSQGRRLVEEQYSWSGVANKMTAAYRWMLTGEARPNFIQGA